MKVNSLSLRTTKNPAVQTDNIIPMFVRIGDLPVRAWFGVIENLAVDVLLGTSFIECCIQGIFTSECKVVLCH